MIVFCHGHSSNPALDRLIHHEGPSSGLSNSTGPIPNSTNVNIDSNPLDQHYYYCQPYYPHQQSCSTFHYSKPIDEISDCTSYCSTISTPYLTSNKMIPSLVTRQLSSTTSETTDQFVNEWMRNSNVESIDLKKCPEISGLTNSSRVNNIEDLSTSDLVNHEEKSVKEFKCHYPSKSVFDWPN